MKPRVFIGSSTGALDVAYTVQQLLEIDADASVWSQDIFSASATTLDGILRALDRSDFAVFVVTPDDAVRVRGLNELAPRDNVLFELGLFIGRLGRERCFIVMPHDPGRLHLPSDLSGISIGTFEQGRLNLAAALAPVASQIRRSIRDLGNHDVAQPFDVRVLEELALSQTRLTSALSSSSRSDDELWLSELCSIAHASAQRIINVALRNAAELYLSYLTVDSETPNTLKAHYLIQELPPERFSSEGKPVPESVPIKGSAAGEALTSGEPQVISTLTAHRGTFDTALLEQIAAISSSIVAWPVSVGGTVVAVVQVDSPRESTFDVLGPAVSSTMKLISSHFGHAFQLGLLMDERSRILAAHASSNAESASE